MNVLIGVVYLESIVIFLWILFVVIIAIKIYKGHIIVDRKNQVAPEGEITLQKEKPKQDADYVLQVKLLQQELERERSKVAKQDADFVRQLTLLQQELERERSKVASLKADLRKETQEKEDALKRLSAIMSSRLRDGNPNVVDLSDQNRPIKVGEQFSELYDNQWTDAYSALESFFGHSKPEPELISVLLDILQQCFSTCKEKANRQLTELNENVTKITTIITKKSSKLPTDLMQRIKEERKMFASDQPTECDMVLHTCKERVSSHVQGKSFLEENSIKRFVQECLKLCWLMVIQDPPMSIITKPDAKGNDNFKAYKTRGKHLAFVVWPALLLEEGGPLIMKGIAEFSDVSTVSVQNNNEDFKF
ncbi:uncharacterized protein LOC123563265 isoform X2 [Mercenaria mercenaria]|uniref:uncharacterized protein LOC123563265 isoform X2 n=1 Tax=Mercenaria mercenaria TaxID=6596 RepID=UPI00234ECCD3|nr:uncharacterized protein LOC123563265 isoform X2 [Mercenaria mercenaria]